MSDSIFIVHSCVHFPCTEECKENNYLRNFNIPDEVERYLYVREEEIIFEGSTYFTVDMKIHNLGRYKFVFGKACNKYFTRLEITECMIHIYRYIQKCFREYVDPEIDGDIDIDNNINLITLTVGIGIEDLPKYLPRKNEPFKEKRVQKVRDERRKVL